jgi:hypothetical protein
MAVRADTTFYDAVTWDYGSSFTINSGITARFLPGSVVDATGATLVGFPGGTGASSFLGLTDTPDFYTGQGGKVVAVKTDASGLEFIVPAAGGGGGGTVTSFSSGNLTPLFNTSVLNATTVPAQSFTLLSAAPHTFLGNETGSTVAPHYVQPNFTDLAGDFALTQTPSLAAGSLIGRTSTGPGDWQQVTIGNGLLMVGVDLRIATTVGDVLASSAPTTNQLAIWTDGTHIKGVSGLNGGSVGQVLKKSTSTDYDWEWAPDISGSGGSSSFIALTDVPPSYTGAGGKFVAVNGTANGLEFVTAPTGGGGNVTSVFGRTGVVVAQSGDYTTFYQPLDTDLTNIAALANQTTFGRGFLTQIDATGARSYIGAGTSNFDGTWTSLTGKPTTLVGFGITDAQPLDADLTALSGVSGTNTLYYRSAANTWSAVTIGPNMTFASGALNAANANWDTAYNERNQWNGGVTGLVAATGRTSLGLDIGVNVQAFDGDLASLAGATSTNAIYYRSGTNTWAPVTIGTHMTFSGGTLDSATGGDVSGPASSADMGFVLYNGTTGKVLRGSTSSGVVVSTAGVFGTITDNSANWNTAFAQTREWDGGLTGLVPATGRTSLGLNAVTNDAQAKSDIYPNAPLPTDGKIPVGITTSNSYYPRTVTGSGATISMNNVGVISIDSIADASLVNVPTHAAVVPNTAPAAGQILVGGPSGIAYAPKTVAGVGATITMGSGGGITIDNIANTSLANSSMTIAGTAVALGGTISLDTLTGLGGEPVGLVKRTATNAMGIAVAGTDDKTAAQDALNVRVVLTNSTFTPTAGVKALYVEVVGGGGGGGGCSRGTGSSAGSGGGGGGYAAVMVATPAGSYTATIGQGGAGGASTGGNGVAGGTTSFGTVAVATGGGGGTGNAQGTVSGPLILANGASGGAGSTGTLKTGGGDGGMAWCFGPSQSQGGEGGSSMFAGTAKAVLCTATGSAGNVYGGGGGGGAVTVSSAAGGAGADGVVRVWEIF